MGIVQKSLEHVIRSYYVCYHNSIFMCTGVSTNIIRSFCKSLRDIFGKLFIMDGHYFLQHFFKPYSKFFWVQQRGGVLKLNL